MRLSKLYILLCLLCVPHLYMVSFLHRNVIEPMMGEFQVPFNTANYKAMADILMGNDAWIMYGGIPILPRVVTILMASAFYAVGTVAIIVSYLHHTDMLITISTLLMVLCIALWYH